MADQNEGLGFSGLGFGHRSQGLGLRGWLSRTRVEGLGLGRRSHGLGLEAITEQIQGLGFLVCVAESGFGVKWAGRTKLRGARLKG